MTNLWARRGDARPLVCFAGHTDVVPTGPLDALGLRSVRADRARRLSLRPRRRRHEGLARGVRRRDRGASSRAHPTHPGSIALLLTSDEEGPSVDGTVRVVERLAAARRDASTTASSASRRRSSALGDMIKNGRRGTLSGTLTVKGVQGHIAYPHLARNPIHLAAPALAELAATRWDDGNAYFPPTTWQCSNIHAGTGATNVIPGTLEVDVQLPLLDREHAANRCSSASSAILDRHGLDYDARLDGLGQALSSRRAARWSTSSARRGARRHRRRARALVHRRHVGRPLHRRHLPRGRRARPGQRDDPQAQRARARSPTSSRWPRSIAASSSGCCSPAAPR